jgi:hypothetical protein
LSGGTEENHETFSQDSRSPGRDIYAFEEFMLVICLLISAVSMSTSYSLFYWTAAITVFVRSQHLALDNGSSDATFFWEQSFFRGFAI